MLELVDDAVRVNQDKVTPVKCVEGFPADDHLERFVEVSVEYFSKLFEGAKALKLQTPEVGVLLVEQVLNQLARRLLTW